MSREPLLCTGFKDPDPSMISCCGHNYIHTYVHMLLVYNIIIVSEIYRVLLIIQAVMEFLKDENWINSSILYQILKREVKFNPLTEDSTAELSIVDSSADSKIIKLYDCKKVCCIWYSTKF